MNREQSRERSNGDLSIIFLVSKTFYVLFSVSIVWGCKKIFKIIRHDLLLENHKCKWNRFEENCPRIIDFVLFQAFKFQSNLPQPPPPRKNKIQTGLYLTPILIYISKHTTYWCVLLCHMFKLHTIRFVCDVMTTEVSIGHFQGRQFRKLEIWQWWKFLCFF